MKVFITGVAGFVGSRLARQLLDRGDSVVGIDNFNTYYAREHKDRHLRDLLPEAGFQFIQADLLEAERLKEIISEQKPDAIAHLAAMAAVRYSVQHPSVYGSVNVMGSLNLMEAARLANPMPRMVMASTGSVYGANTPVPFREDAAADRPLAPYPASKRAMELLAHSHHHIFRLPITVVRFFNVYGPQGRPDMMPWQWTFDILARKELTLYNAGRLKRDWTYIDDIVAGFVAALDKPLGFEIVNLGCGNPVENTRFVQILESLLGKKAKVIDTPTPSSEPPISFADISKANKLLGYEPRVLVEEGLKNFIHWLRSEKLI
ncbi:MAG TPA: NAD-dependent epimerase/dehydratase family protein [Tepidisphaeraceae bacterium]|jgi:UDP-glucuronate 4-epimerase